MTTVRRRPAVLLVVLSFALIAFMTLRPTRATIITPTFCIFCGTLGGVDFILNIVLFVPLGIGLRWTTGRLLISTVIGLATTLVIETLQWRVITGRDASLGDLLANTLGTMLGAWIGTVMFTWLTATGPAARRYARTYGIAAAVILTASAIFLQPLVPRYPQWVKWMPVPPNAEPFRGELLSAEIKGRTVHRFESFKATEVFDSSARTLSVKARIRLPASGPTRLPAVIVGIANDLEEGFVLAQFGNAAAFTSHMVAERVRLRSIMVGLKDAFSSTVTTSSPGEVVIEGYSGPRGIIVRRHASAGSTAVSFPRTVGLGWAMLLPWNVALDRGWLLLNAIWLAGWFLPVSFFSVRSSKVADKTPSIVAWWPVILMVVTLVIATAALRLSPLGIGEWAGILAGVSAGWLIARSHAPDAGPVH